MTSKKLRVLGWCFALSLVACGSGGPQAQLKTIDELLAKDLPMTQEQRGDFDDYLAEGKRLLEEGHETESSEVLDKAIAILKIAEDAALFNKSE